MQRLEFPFEPINVVVILVVALPVRRSRMRPMGGRLVAGQSPVQSSRPLLLLLLLWVVGLGGRGGGEVGGAGAGEGGVGGSRQGGGTRGGSWARHNWDSKSVVVGQTPPLRLLQDVLWVVHGNNPAVWDELGQN